MYRHGEEKSDAVWNGGAREVLTPMLMLLPTTLCANIKKI